MMSALRTQSIALLLLAQLAGATARAAEVKAPARPAEQLGSAVSGSDAVRVWLNPGIYSRHFDRDLNLRENNYGFGVEVTLAPEHAVLVGEYRNSNDVPTRYATYYWRPLQWGPARFGLMAGAFNGYPVNNGGWFAAVFPAASLEFDRVGVNFTILPSYQDKIHGAFAVQLKLRVW